MIGIPTTDFTIPTVKPERRTPDSFVRVRFMRCGRPEIGVSARVCEDEMVHIFGKVFNDKTGEMELGRIAVRSIHEVEILPL